MDLSNSGLPRVFRQWAPAAACPHVDEEELARAAVPPATAEFALARGDTVRTWLPPNPSLSLPLFHQLRRQGWRPSLFVMNAQTNRPRWSEIARDAVRSAPWRTFRLGLSMSVADSQIPAHADDADVVVVQSQGVREWRVWPSTPELVDRRRLLVERQGRLVDPDRAESVPCCLTVALYPGDALFIPAFHLHAARSDAQQDGPVASASLVYDAITPFSLLKASGLPTEAVDDWANRDQSFLFEALPDPQPGCDPFEWYQSFFPPDMRAQFASRLSHGWRGLTAL